MTMSKPSLDKNSEIIRSQRIKKKIITMVFRTSPPPIKGFTGETNLPNQLAKVFLSNFTKVLSQLRNDFVTYYNCIWLFVST